MATIRLKIPDLRVNTDDKIYFRFTLDADAGVVLKVYNISQVLVRTLDCGDLVAGDYTSRQKAVLWDRLSDTVERASSGQYSMVATLDGSPTGQRVVYFTLN